MRGGPLQKEHIAGFLVLILVIGAIAGGTAYYEKQSSARLEEELREKAKEYEPEWPVEDTVFIDDMTYGFDHRLEKYLFIGTDGSGSGEGEEYHGPMADFLLLMVLDYTDNTLGCIQIDRNTITKIPEIGAKGDLLGERTVQLCTAHWFGGTPKLNAENTVEAVKYFLGELDSIDGYFVMNMQDIAALNHTVGGVEVTIDGDMTSADRAFTDGATLTLDDNQAERFVRARMSLKDDSNQARMSRQKQYMDGLFQKVREHTRSNPEYGLQLWDSLQDVAVSDMNGMDFSRIARMLLDGEDKGILKIEGESKLGKVLNDGLEHEEFYADPISIRDVMTDLFSLVPLGEDYGVTE